MQKKGGRGFGKVRKERGYIERNAGAESRERKRDGVCLNKRNGDMNECWSGLVIDAICSHDLYEIPLMVQSVVIHQTHLCLS